MYSEVELEEISSPSTTNTHTDMLHHIKRRGVTWFVAGVLVIVIATLAIATWSIVNEFLHETPSTASRAGTIVVTSSGNSSRMILQTEDFQFLTLPDAPNDDTAYCANLRFWARGVLTETITLMDHQVRYYATQGINTLRILDVHGNVSQPFLTGKVDLPEYCGPVIGILTTEASRRYPKLSITLQHARLMD